MRIGKAHRQAYTAHDIAFAALTQFWESLPRGPQGPKLSREDALALCELSRTLEAWQERIRIHRRQPLPGTAKPKSKSTKDRRGQVRPGPGAGGRAPLVLRPAARSTGGTPPVGTVAPPVTVDQPEAEDPTELDGFTASPD